MKLDLAVGIEHRVKAALGTDVKPLIDKHGHDLSGCQWGVLRLVPSETVALTLFVGQLVQDQAWIAFRTIVNTAITESRPSANAWGCAGRPISP